MSRRSILLATTVCVSLATTAAIEQASAHGGGGGGGGGGFHSTGAPSMSRMPSQTFGPVEHFSTFAHTKAMPEEVSRFAHQKVFKAGNGVTPTADGGTTVPVGLKVTKPAITPAVNQPPQVATKSVPPTPVKTGTIVGKPAITPAVNQPPQVATQSVPPTPIKTGPVSNEPAIPPALDPPSQPAGPPIAKQIGVIPAGTIVDKPAIPSSAFTPGMIVLKPGPEPMPPAPPAPSQTPPAHMMPGAFTGGVVIAGVEGDLTDASCYWIKRKLLTPDGEVIRRVKVCEVIDEDQP